MKYKFFYSTNWFEIEIHIDIYNIEFEKKKNCSEKRKQHVNYIWFKVWIDCFYRA